MITLRIKSENGTLKCEYSEVERVTDKSREDYYKQLDHYNFSFQPITLSEEAREYLMAIYTSSFGFEAALLPDELSGKSTECFEVKGHITDETTMEYVLHLKSVPVAENGIKEIADKILYSEPCDSEDESGQYWRGDSVAKLLLKALEYKNQHNHSSDWDEVKEEYFEYSQSQFDAGNNYLPLIEWLKENFTITKIK